MNARLSVKYCHHLFLNLKKPQGEYMKKVMMLAAACGFLAACQTTGNYTPVSENLPKMTVAFTAAPWDGKTVPADQVCSRYGGKASTPAMKVTGIPTEANAIIVEYNDRNYSPLSYDGGHGKIGYWTNGATSLDLQSVAAESDDMSGNAFVEQRHRGRMQVSGYLPPCSGGRGNAYFAEVKAVYKAKAEGEESKLLAVGHIELGKY
jgi:hypothetical protein